MPKITIATDHIDLDVKDNFSLIDLDGECQSSIIFGCKDASCGSCIVQVLDGADNLSQMEEKEREFLDTSDSKEGERLACQCKVLKGDVTIDVSDY